MEVQYFISDGHLTVLGWILLAWLVLK